MKLDIWGFFSNLSWHVCPYVKSQLSLDGILWNL